MPTLDELDNQLVAAAHLLDLAAATIRDCPLQPTREHIRRIGEALSQVFDIQRAIYERRPDLTPMVLRDAPGFSAASGRLAAAVSKAHKLGEVGQFAEAESILSEYIAAESSDRHRAAAQIILDRHRGSSAA
jgi:hypothetical protein